MKLTVAYSPCPNDTFMFHGLAKGMFASPCRDTDIHLHDMETLNRLAMKGTYDVTKVSFHTYFLVQDEYELLNVGAAMGYDCGPVVVSAKDLQPSDLSSSRIAVPGELTTAHLLLQLWAPQARNRIFARYDEIMDLVSSGQVDVGVIIHEGRFTYHRSGFCLLVDLGQWWREQTDLPVPLGGIVARKNLGQETIREFEVLLRKAIENAIGNPEAACEYASQHAQEMDEAVLAEHIKTFVNDYSLDLGADGRSAVEKLRELAKAGGLIP